MHGYTKNMKDYKFSSYQYYLKIRGKEWLDDSFSTYPIIDFTKDTNKNTCRKK